MKRDVPVELPNVASRKSPPNSTGRIEIEAAIDALEQQVTQLDEARYEALREVRDVNRRITNLSLQALEARIRLCALIECEPLHDCERIQNYAPAILRLTHLYFDEHGKYRLALYPYPDQESETPQGTGDPLWCSEVVYDETRPEGKGKITIADAVRKAYGAAKGRGYRLAWNSTEVPAA